MALNVNGRGNRDRGSSRGGHGNKDGGIDVDRRTDSSNINNNKCLGLGEYASISARGNQYRDSSRGNCVSKGGGIDGARRSKSGGGQTLST